MKNNFSITLQGISKSFKSAKGLENVSLTFGPNLLHGIIGPEGAGKTTLLRLVAGLYCPNQGSIFFSLNGEKVEFGTIRSLIAYMPERQSLYPDLTIKEHLDFFAKIYQLSSEDYQQKRAKLLSITRLDRFLDRPAGKLSGGMYKKLGLICALLRSPQILLLDEPTNGVDPISRREFWDLLYSLWKEGILVIVATAYMDEAERCSQSHLFEAGRLLFSGIPSELLANHQVKDFNELMIKQMEC